MERGQKKRAVNKVVAADGGSEKPGGSRPIRKGERERCVAELRASTGGGAKDKFREQAEQGQQG